MTDAERKLWFYLSRKQLDGYRFRRQSPIGRYIVDFVCYERKLVVELDGGQHNTEHRLRKDEQRTLWLHSQGFTVVRFWNNEVFENLEGVMEVIHKHLKD